MPRIPARSIVNTSHKHSRIEVLGAKETLKSNSARNNTASTRLPKRNAGVMIAVPVICKKAKITPIKMPARIADVVQRDLKIQLQRFVFLPPF